MIQISKFKFWIFVLQNINLLDWHARKENHESMDLASKLMHKSKGYQTISAYLQPLTIAKTSVEINNGVLAYCACVVVLA